MNYEYYRFEKRNLNKIKPARGKALIMVNDKNKTDSGIVFAYSNSKPFIPDHGVVVLVSQLDNFEDIKVGDVVLFEKYQGYRFRDEDDNDYILVELNKITGVFV